ncbi:MULTISPECIES: hypothetical protein [Streptomyces]|uniref:HNH endonuclease n=1 Tax=Streptomyces fradiae ATCC 10745 = DSM 40063 TaxID=1319510 RepID=A0ABQ6XLC0_STRFR|nr:MULTISPECIES: hypothetical protein [Streptomyces]KAF0646583.1 hypothetical protein K701_27935 [Streptomyces fradiae ATCC 10745 = DSM 40063]
MTTTVIPHTLNHPTTSDYRTLTPTAQALFDRAQELADNTVDAREYNAFMQIAAHAAGLPTTPGAEVVHCACPTCHCAQIFPTDLPGLHTVETTDYNLPRLQCPTCTDAHPTPHDD